MEKTEAHVKCIYIRYLELEKPLVAASEGATSVFELVCRGSGVAGGVGVVRRKAVDLPEDDLAF